MQLIVSIPSVICITHNNIAATNKKGETQMLNFLGQEIQTGKNYVYLKNEQTGSSTDRELCMIGTVKKLPNSFFWDCLWKSMAEALEIERNQLFDEFAQFMDYPYSDRLRAVRKAYGFHQATFVEKAGFSLCIYSKWEGGSRQPSRKMYRQTYLKTNI